MTPRTREFARAADLMRFLTGERRSRRILGQDAAAAAGATPSAVTDWDHGTSRPMVARACAYAAFLGYEVSIDGVAFRDGRGAARALETARLRRGLTRDQVSRAASVHTQTIREWELRQSLPQLAPFMLCVAAVGSRLVVSPFADETRRAA